MRFSASHYRFAPLNSVRRPFTLRAHHAVAIGTETAVTIVQVATNMVAEDATGA